MSITPACGKLLRMIGRFLLFVFLLQAPLTLGANPRVDIEKAVELMEKRHYTFARTYLEPSLISPYISSGERSRAYYLRGFSFLAQNMAVSAFKDFNRALEFNPANPAAVVELGRLYMSGKGVDKDSETAVGLIH